MERTTTAVARLKENGFDFVHDSQRVFMSLMMAMAMPGDIRRIEALPLRITRGEHAGILQAFLTLLDLETGFCVCGRDGAARGEMEAYLSINTNAAVADHAVADFVLCLDGGLDGRFSALKRGSLEAPHRSATVFYLVDGIARGPETGARELVLSGPGVRDRKSVHVRGLAESEISEWKIHRRAYPVGIDVYLVGRGGELVGIPRSAAVTA